MKKILVVEDEPSIVTLLVYTLEQDGFSVTSADNGRKGMELALSGQFDFIILDLMLPQLHGMEVCKKLRQAGVDTPILMLTARDDELDKIIGLELGADDYMTKPFSPREVIARVKAILRRSHRSTQETERVLQVQDLTLFEERHEVYQSGQLLSLTPKEFELLRFLMKRANRTHSREHLLDKIWGYDYTGETRMVDVHIGKLREKLELDTKNPRYIQTVRGFGYKFVGDKE
ncbi:MULTISPECIES: response regulator transcription factor [unclassified Streptococcus]|uniref:response regulator transcription factor n=1 Tax=unclassified Streptococcus TaxID=2608887 RepID=UPI00359ED11C